MNYFGNHLYPPITSPDYAMALAMRGVLSSYDYIVQQPSVLTWEQGEAFLRAVGRPPKDPA